LLPTTYEWWASRGVRYGADKHALAEQVVSRFARRFPRIEGAVRMVDVSTPLTFWRHARSWRGAYEGWLPTPDTFHAHVPSTIDGLDNVYLAGQWLHPGGGIPPSLLSGRQAVVACCEREGVPFSVAELLGGTGVDARVPVPTGAQ
ncbi:MAG: hypothetical protein ACOCUS_02305, partial [Polyangiales bacterium]